MTTLTNHARSTLRRALIDAGISTRGRTDDDLTAAYEEHKAATAKRELGVESGIDTPPVKTPLTPAQVEKEIAKVTTPQVDVNSVAAQIAALMASMQAPAPQLDEQQLVRLINQHATKSIEVTAPETGKTVKIEGAHPILEDLIVWASCRVNVWLNGPAGSGKTTLAQQVATALDLPFYSTGSVLAAYELVGTLTAHGEYKRTPLREAYENGGVFLQDEIDGCNERALLALNKLLDSDSFRFPDMEVAKHPEFVVIAAANTVGNGATRQYNGRTKIDQATLDRYTVITVDYNEDLERRVAMAEYNAHGGTNDDTLEEYVSLVQSTRAKLASANILALVTPRASKYGARALAKGLSKSKVVESLLARHLTPDQRAQVGM